MCFGHYPLSTVHTVHFGHFGLAITKIIQSKLLLKVPQTEFTPGFLRSTLSSKIIISNLQDLIRRLFN